MSSTSLAHPAHQTTTGTAETAEVMEGIIERLRRARPELDGRIGRAEHIIVTQLSVSNGHRPVKVRLHADGSHEYRVRSGSRLRREYTINPRTFGCDCPWSQHGGTGCCHAIACWVMERALRRAETAVVSPRVECAGCGSLAPCREMFAVLEEHDNLTFFEGDLLCRGCALDHGTL